MSVAAATLPTWWKPTQDRIDGSNINRFRKLLNGKYGVDLKTYDDLHAFSVERLEDFWSTLWAWAGVRHDRMYTRVLSDSRAVPGDLPRFFDDALVNLAENILFPLHPMNTTACMPNAPKEWPSAKSTAIYEWGEAMPSNAQGMPRQWDSVSWGELRRRVAVLSTALRRKGLKPGDRVAHLSANSAHPIVTFLACLAVGCVFSALPTDAGAQAIYGRLAQVQPRLVLTDDVAYYNGRKINVIDRIAEVCDRLIDNGKLANGQLDVVYIVNRRGTTSAPPPKPTWQGKRIGCVSLEEYVQSAGLRHDAKGKSVPALTFEALPFNHPALIVFSSGTTGEPKSICHSAGGILINGKKEALLQYELRNTDTFLQITTCGWIMWLAQVTMLLAGSSIITYDGSPLLPSAFCVPHIIETHGKVTGFGGSPRLLTEMERACKTESLARMRDRYPMRHLRLVTSTGSPLNPANVRFFYDSMVQPSDKGDDDKSHRPTQLMSISGGTDLAGCLISSAVIVPVQGHLLGGKTLAMDVRIVDPLTGEDCEKSGEAGELVCAKPFPTQPLYFWGDQKDKDALHEKYMDSYYRRFTDGPAKGWWAQGDFISRHNASGAYEIHGRSDGVLNPSGVRFGSAEIYSVVETEKFAPFVADSIVVGQRRPGKDEDESVLLFVKCRPGQPLTDERKAALAQAIKQAYSARHVPKHIFQVSDIPLTANGKKTELAVKAVVCGNTKFKPSTAIANPDSLDEYRRYADIEKVVAGSRESKL